MWRDFRCLCTVTFWRKVDFCISSARYYLLLYGAFFWNWVLFSMNLECFSSSINLRPCFKYSLQFSNVILKFSTVSISLQIHGNLSILHMKIRKPTKVHIQKVGLRVKTVTCQITSNLIKTLFPYVLQRLILKVVRYLW